MIVIMGGNERVKETIRRCKATEIISIGREAQIRVITGNDRRTGKKWSKCEEPEKVSEGGSSRTNGVDSEGMYSKGRADDDRYRRGAAGSDISTSGGGMSMVVGGSSSRLHAY